MSEPSTSPTQRNGSATKRQDRRDPRLPVAEMFDAEIAAQLWTSLPEDCRQDHFDKRNMPQAYRAAVSENSAGRSWTTTALNMRGLPETMTQEMAWLVHREIEIGRRIHPVSFNATMRVVRVATVEGGQAARNATSLLHLSPEEWVCHGQAARLRGADLGISSDIHAVPTLRRLQDVLVYPYHQGPWWQLNVWNPMLDPRVPRREHEPQGRHVANFSQLDADWLRNGAKLWLSVCLETERYCWSSVKSRLDALKWLQRHLDNVGDAGPTLVGDPEHLREFVRGFVAALRSHIIATGPRTGMPLAGNPRRQIMTTIESFYAWMYDNQGEAAATLQDPRWLTLGPAHGVLFRPGDKPRLTNKHNPDMVLEDDVVAQIAKGAELLALPHSEGGFGELSAFHALMLLIRTGRRISEILMMDFDPLLPLVGPKPGDSSGLVARLRYQQTKIQSAHVDTIPVDAEIVAIITAQQAEARKHMVTMGSKDSEPRYLFPRPQENRNGAHPYSTATLHCILGRLTEKLGITDSQNRLVRISNTHRFRHTAATNLLNAGVPLHVVMRYFGHVTPTMTMHYAVTLSQTAEREFLRFKKVTTDGRALGIDEADLYDVLQLDKGADRVLPNGWCMLPPKQVCNRGNACLSCDKFVTDASHAPELSRQLTDTEQLIDQRKTAFLSKYGTSMDQDNIWLQGRETETTSLRQILLAINDVSEPNQAVRGCGVNDRSPGSARKART